MLKIYGRASSWNVRKVTFLAEETGLTYERFDYGRGYAPTTTPEFMAMNPNGKVPVLVDGDAIIWESHTILRYLAAKYAPELYPQDLVARAHVDQWLDWKISSVATPMMPLFFRHFLKMGDYTDHEVAAGEAEAQKLFAIIEGQLAKTGGYICGPAFTIADCAIGVAVHRWLNLPLKRLETSHIMRYYAELSKKSSFRKTVLIGIP